MQDSYISIFAMHTGLSYTPAKQFSVRASDYMSR
jgi:hypothetical protein